MRDWLLFGLALFTTCTLANGQNSVSELMSASVVPYDSNGMLSAEFKAQLRSELQDVRVIALGEATHEDGATFQEKSKLVKFLHSELGFEVLAFEFGFYGNYLANEKLKSGVDPKEAFKNSGWSKSKQAYPVYEYLAGTHQTDFPLQYAGFDGEKVPDGIPNITAFIEGLSAELDYEITGSEQQVLDSLIGAVYGGMSNKLKPAISYAQRQRALKVIDSLEVLIHRRQEEPNAGKNEIDWKMDSFVLNSIRLDEKSDFAGNFWNIVRDKHMAQRIIWLADSIYPDKKIILWGASGHFARNMIEIERSLEPRDYGFYPYYQTGDWLYSRFGDAYYAMAFVAGEGQIGTIYPEGNKFKAYESLMDLNEPESGSYESLALEAGEDHLYTSLRNVPESIWLHQTFTAHPLGYKQDYAPWKSVFDAFFFIRQMEPDQW